MTEQRRYVEVKLLFEERVARQVEEWVLKGHFPDRAEPFLWAYNIISEAVEQLEENQMKVDLTTVSVKLEFDTPSSPQFLN